MRSKIAVLLVLLLLAAPLLALPAAYAEDGIRSVAELNSRDVTVGISPGSAGERAVRAELPEARLAFFDDKFMGYEAVAHGKIDAFIYDLRQMELSIENGQRGVHLLDETLGETVEIALGISPVSEIPDLEKQVNRFLAGARADGTLDDMFRRWVVEGDEKMPVIELPEKPALHLTVGTSGISPPYTFYKDNRLCGYDIELAYRFARWLGADLSFRVYDYSSIFAAAVSGDADVLMANLHATPERRESFLFSDVLFEEKLGVMVRGEAPRRSSAMDALNGGRIGVQIGTIFDEIVLARLPDVQFEYFGTYTDLAAALEGGKIDGFPGDEPVLRLVAAEHPSVEILDEPLDSFDTAIALPKGERGEALKAELDAWLRSARESGELEELITKWLDRPEDEKTMPVLDNASAPRGVLRLATDPTYAPMEYYRDGEIVGLEIDMAARFCLASGYGLELVPMTFDGILPAVQSGKADFAASCFSITEERMESVNFSEAFYPCNTLMAVLRTRDAAKTGRAGGVMSSLEKTFLRENRWRLFVQGVGNTLLITALSLLFGTLLGFAAFMLCRSGSPVANAVTRFCTWLVQGMPAVVLLMILYYIVFGSLSVSGVTVAVIGLSLTFGAAVFGLLKLGVGAVDRGQYEAASALGFSDRRTFFRIILPQAVPHILPAFKGEVVALLKATAIVGYIAVQDLTKMGDIVRSRTYEAFFPLIAVTVIYFLLEGAIGVLIRLIERRCDPKRRSPETILKGVRTDA
ncbi:MAG: transporter substrate-binding domain-containing protein [Oscillospiraceae bacterium]|nr:transporter substrate-binding domain-containing protein [Oscillospiraceae bacterium]